MKMKHIIRAFNQLWDNLKPRKVVMLFWLTPSYGIFVGVWLKQMGMDGNYSIYHQGTLEIAQHKFIKCPCVLSL
jgi:hypothetical protein